MGRSKRTPERSTLVRSKTPAFSRRQRPGDDKGEAPDKPGTAQPTEPTQIDVKPLADAAATSKASAAPTDPTHIDIKPLTDDDVPAASARRPDKLPDIVPPDPRGEPWPDATPVPMAPVEPGELVRPRSATVAMPSATTPYGRPPDMPRTAAPPPLTLGAVENPAHMPSPKEIPSGSPDDPAPAPGTVPPGDSRSLRRGDEFALVYRVGSCVITRSGRVGTRGQWRVVEYPTSTFASNSYAKECSRFVSEGFSDYRE